MTRKELFRALFSLIANLQLEAFIKVAENNLSKV
jgi:hypothetical protein